MHSFLEREAIMVIAILNTLFVFRTCTQFCARPVPCLLGPPCVQWRDLHTASRPHAPGPTHTKTQTNSRPDQPLHITDESVERAVVMRSSESSFPPAITLLHLHLPGYGYVIILTSSACDHRPLCSAMIRILPRGRERMRTPFLPSVSPWRKLCVANRHGDLARSPGETRDQSAAEIPRLLPHAPSTHLRSSAHPLCPDGRRGGDTNTKRARKCSFLLCGGILVFKRGLFR